jgi:hypothetical protein
LARINPPTPGLLLLLLTVTHLYIAEQPRQATAATVRPVSHGPRSATATGHSLSSPHSSPLSSPHSSPLSPILSSPLVRLQTLLSSPRLSSLEPVGGDHCEARCRGPSIRMLGRSAHTEPRICKEGAQVARAHFAPMPQVTRRQLHNSTGYDGSEGWQI